MKFPNRMIIINLTGQLGNQMFQFALGHHLEKLGRNVKYDLSYYKQHPEHYLGLKRFGLRINEADSCKTLAFREDRHRLVDRIRRKLFGSHPRVLSEVGSGSYAFRQEVFSFKKGLLDGYWQSELYFKNIADEIFQCFTFPISKEPRNIEVAKRMHECVSVGIHVRRGDYLGGFPVLDERYYYPAMNYFNGKYDNVHFFVFSNDISWCKQHFAGYLVSFVDWNNAEDSLFDIWLMTQCKHNIIANSSFSWWGAWLNQNSDKEVIAPDIWFFHAQTPDIYAQGWKVFPVGNLTD